MGCALGAIVGNLLFLRSANTMLFACAGTCVAVLAALLAARRAVFTEDDLGCLVKRLDGREARHLDALAGPAGGDAAADAAAGFPSKAKALQRRAPPQVV